MNDQYDTIPPKVRAAIDRYATERIQPGDFTTAVLCNNFSDAIAHADENSLRAIREIMIYVYNEIPGNCWGSKEKVIAWLKEEE